MTVSSVNLNEQPSSPFSSIEAVHEQDSANRRANKMSSSLPPSTSVIPQGVGAPPPPGLDPKRGKLMCIKVRMLDDTVGVFHLGHKAIGQALFDEVCRHLNLLECDYFGLEFMDCYGNHVWLDKEKPILRQITSSQSDARFYFVVKFYTPNPADLEEEYTRFVFALQIKRDLGTGQFVVNENTAALMVSYIVQAECGDFSPEDYHDHTYLSCSRFVPNQSPEFEKKVMEHHMKLVGMSPADADLSLLETSRRCDFYGVKFHPARDIEGTPVNLACLHLGIRVYHQYTLASTFSWAKIRKMSFKRKKFLIKLHPESYQYYKDTIEFMFETRNESKGFWKKCVEHHAFFRCVEPGMQPKAKQQGSLFSKGSSFRYHGRTQKQLIDYVREHHKRREPFTRPIHSSFSNKPSSRLPGMTPQTDRSLPTPLLPVASRSGQNGDLQVHHVADGRLGGTPPYHQNHRAPGDGHHLPHETNGGSPPGTPKLHRKIKEVDASPIRGDYILEEQSVILTANFVSDGGMLNKNGVRKESPSKKDSGANAVFERASTSVSPTGGMYSSFGKSAIRNPRLWSAESTSSGGLTLGSSVDGIQSSTPPFPRRMGPSGGPLGAVMRPMLLSQDSGATSSQSDRDIPGKFHAEGTGTLDAQGRKKRLPSEKAYYIAKELLMTERTYNKDLALLTENFNETVSKLEDFSAKLLDELFLALRPLKDFHRNFLIEIEQKVASWEGKVTAVNSERATSSITDLSSTSQHLGDSLLCAAHNTFDHYRHYISHLAIYMANIDELFRTKKSFESAYKDFELRKFCYLPLNQLLLKPPHRLLVWQQCLGRLMGYYIEIGGNHPDLSDCRVALERVAELNQSCRPTLESLENFAKLVELERDLPGVDNLVQPNRLFFREGSLQRYSKRGPVQRLFLLFSDCLIYANRTGATPGVSSQQHLNFKLHGQIPLRGFMMEDGDPFHAASGLQNCFTIYGGNRSLVVSASSPEEKSLWVIDINKAVASAKENNADLPNFATLRSTSSTDDVECFSRGVDSKGSEDRELRSPSMERQVQHRAQDTLHVCWHRCTTLGKEDIHKAGKNQLSGYLLRKFRNSGGWQKLWVVYAQFCLFFYKSHIEDSPLASLPLLGYNAGPPSGEDGISKENVFKLHYKTHFYFFRAESEYTHHRWLEVIRSACTVKPGPIFTNVPVLPE